MSDQREGGPFPTIIVGHTELSNTNARQNEKVAVMNDN